jgi:hypothetical protein
MPCSLRKEISCFRKNRASGVALLAFLSKKSERPKSIIAIKEPLFFPSGRRQKTIIKCGFTKRALPVITTCISRMAMRRRTAATQTEPVVKNKLLDHNLSYPK